MRDRKPEPTQGSHWLDVHRREVHSQEGSVKVTTEHTHETFLVGRNNLERRDRTPDDPGYYVTFGDGEYKRHTFASNEECQEFLRSFRSGREGG